MFFYWVCVHTGPIMYNKSVLLQFHRQFRQELTVAMTKTIKFISDELSGQQISLLCLKFQHAVDSTRTKEQQDNNAIRG